MQLRELVVPPDESSVESPLEGRCTLEDPQKPVGRKRVSLPLQYERLDRLDLDRAACEQAGLLADQDLARLGGLLEPGGNIDRIAGGQTLLGTGDDLAGVDADT
jgi:hypothetical protein